MTCQDEILDNFKEALHNVGLTDKVGYYILNLEFN